MRPTPLPQALKELSARTGRKLAVTPALSDEIVFWRLRNAPVETTLTHLAQVVLAKWRTESDGTLRLVPDLDLQRAIERREKLDAEQTLNGSLAYLTKRLAAQPADLDARSVRSYLDRLAKEAEQRKIAEAARDYERMATASSTYEEAPAWRAVARIAPLLGNRLLLEMPNTAKQVWAEKPTPMQRPFSTGAQVALAKYRKELALLKPEVEVSRVKLEAVRWEQGGAFNLTLIALDPAGTMLDRLTVRMNNDSDLMKIPLRLRHPVTPVPGERPLEVPPEAKEARTLLSSASTDQQRGELLPKWSSLLIDPVGAEPTQWYVAADLMSAAEALDKNLIGTPSDLTGGAYYKEERRTPSQLLQTLGPSVDLVHEGWILYRDREPFYRAPRAAARALLVDSVQRGGITVDAAADWASRTPLRWPFLGWVGNHIKTLFSGRGPYSSLATTGDDTRLRLWSELGAAARRDLRSGETLDVSRLPSAAKTRIAQMVYWDDALDAGDPTDLLPNGIASGTVSLKVIEKPVLVGWSSRSSRGLTPQPLDAKMLGTYLAVGNKWFEIPRETYLAYDRFLLGVNRTYDLQFTLQPGALPMSVSLTETLFDPKAPAVQRLPEVIRREVEIARRAALEKERTVLFPALFRRDLDPDSNLADDFGGAMALVFFAMMDH